MNDNAANRSAKRVAKNGRDSMSLLIQDVCDMVDQGKTMSQIKAKYPAIVESWLLSLGAEP